MPLLVRNGQIVTASERYNADIYCEDETITRIGVGLEAPKDTEIIDAEGMYVFPGFIDPHVHIHLPFMGTFAKDTHETASRAALIGGTTTYIEMICPTRDEEPMAAFEHWNGLASKGSICDYSFHMGVTHFDDKAEAQLHRIVDAGIASFKVFLAYKGAFGLEDEELYHTLRLAKELGVITTAHCENATLVQERQKKLIAEGKTGPEWHEPSRPPRVEADGIHHLVTFAEMHGAHIYTVHTSCDEALHVAQAARYRGVNIWVETLIQYLLLDKTYAERPDFEGAKYVMSPPLRHKQNQPVLWSGLRSGLISTVATDHAPFDFASQKTMGKEDFTKIPNGIPAIEDRVNLLYAYGVCKGELDLHQFVDVASTQAAKLFGLFPRKGTIQPGSDADLVIFDPNKHATISATTQRMNIDYSAFEGWPIQGNPHVVTVRGKVAVRDCRCVLEPGNGKLLQRRPSH